MKEANNTTPARNVDEYLQALPETVRFALEKVRQTIKAAAPEAEEVISYRVPTYKYRGALLHLAAFTKHCSLVVVNKNILATFAQELQAFKTAGTTIHFTPDQPLPAALIRKIVKTRMKQNESRNAAEQVYPKSKKL